MYVGRYMGRYPPIGTDIYFYEDYFFFSGLVGYVIVPMRVWRISIKIEWDLTNGPRSVSCDRAIRYSGFFGVRSVGPTVGDFFGIYACFNACFCFP